MAIKDFRQAKHTKVKLSAEHCTLLSSAIDREQHVKSVYQATEMRLRADLLDAQREKVAVLKIIAQEYNFDVSGDMALDDDTGELSKKPKPID